jgi:predicted ATPase
VLEDAQSGRRGLVFVTGEPGIGKTRLVAEFFERLALRETDAPLRSVRGVCVEHHGESEPYGPVIDALERLASEDGRLQSVLGSLAPRWLAQLPWRLDDKESKALQSALAIATPTRMLRELCRALEAFTAETTLVLWLEDLHWSDPSTIDLLAALANRPEPARLLVICTYRPVEAAMSEHRDGRQSALHGHAAGPHARAWVAGADRWGLGARRRGRSGPYEGARRPAGGRRIPAG